MFIPAWTSVPPSAASSLALDAAIDIWLIDLDVAPTRLGDLLNDEERARASRFRFPVHAHRFAVARGCLRSLLGSYLGCNPKEIAFDYGAWGKPALRAPACEGLAFNLAHSGAKALIVIGRTEALGIDIEMIRPVADWLDIAMRTFAPAETKALLSLPAHEQMEGFFACWTRKEAVVKLWGEGLSADLTSFEVSLDPHTSTCLMTTERRDREVNDIMLLAFKTDLNAWAALASPAGAGSPRFWRLR
jgi:4'-phosphopantetheinyl transferase